MSEAGKKKLGNILDESNGMIPGGKKPITDDELGDVAGGYTELDESLPTYNYWIQCPVCYAGESGDISIIYIGANHVKYQCNECGCIFRVDSKGNTTIEETSKKK